ncbi:hypothetical protein ES703_47336 [subsurface metagenome]
MVDSPTFGKGDSMSILPNENVFTHIPIYPCLWMVFFKYSNIARTSINRSITIIAGMLIARLVSHSRILTICQSDSLSTTSQLKIILSKQSFKSIKGYSQSLVDFSKRLLLFIVKFFGLGQHGNNSGILSLSVNIRGLWWNIIQSHIPADCIFANSESISNFTQFKIFGVVKLVKRIFIYRDWSWHLAPPYTLKYNTYKYSCQHQTLLSEV